MNNNKRFNQLITILKKHKHALDEQHVSYIENLWNKDPIVLRWLMNDLSKKVTETKGNKLDNISASFAEYGLICAIMKVDLKNKSYCGD